MIQDGAMIGMGSIVLDRARVGRRTMLTAGSVVTEDGKIPPEVLATGLPQRPRRISTEAPRSGSRAPREYQALRLHYMGGTKSAVTGNSGDESARSAE